MDGYRSRLYDHNQMNTTGICSQKSGALTTRCWLGDQQLVRLDYFCCRTVPFLFFDGITLSRNATTDLIAGREEATTNQSEWKTIPMKLSNPSKIPNQMDGYCSRQYNHDQTNTTGICSQKSGARTTRCWLEDQQLVRLDYFCCRKVPFLFFDGITLSRNATTNSIAGREESTTNIDRNGKQFQ
jgi:hypothetical protein